jgi:NAD(P)-dependent dehydrogenase (short-subunit alcohol dehydrogenase family)
MDFANRTVVVTGAAGALGRAVAAAFAGRGARLVLFDKDGGALAEVFGAEDARRWFAPIDLLDRAQLGAAARQAVERFGGIDVLCNVAGGFRMGEAVHETSHETWSFLFDVNARTMLNASNAVVPHLLARGGGKIVNVGAFAGQRGVAQMGAYTASKSAVIRLTEAMSAELREKHVNVNCVLPTTLDTPVNRAAMPDADPSRWVAPEDLANVIVFLASDLAKAVHGAAIPVVGLG